MPSEPSHRPSVTLHSGSTNLHCVCGYRLIWTNIALPIRCDGCGRVWHTRVEMTAGEMTALERRSPTPDGEGFNA